MCLYVNKIATLYIDEKDYQKMLDKVYGKDKYTHADV